MTTEYATKMPTIPANYMKYLKPVDKVAFKITKKIQYATQMNLMPIYAGEPYQIANYGIGGQYGVHHDPHQFHGDSIFQEAQGHANSVFNKATGDRVATFMAYLSNVQAGGKTVFPVLGIASTPQEGDAIFWINTKSCGRLHKWTFHTGCPVIVGSKWITNKWIQYYDQFRKFYCHVDENVDDFEAFDRYRNQNLAV